VKITVKDHNIHGRMKFNHKSKDNSDRLQDNYQNTSIEKLNAHSTNISKKTQV